LGSIFFLHLFDFIRIWLVELPLGTAAVFVYLPQEAQREEPDVVDTLG